MQTWKFPGVWKLTLPGVGLNSLSARNTPTLNKQANLYIKNNGSTPFYNLSLTESAHTRINLL